MTRHDASHVLCAEVCPPSRLCCLSNSSNTASKSLVTHMCFWQRPLSQGSCRESCTLNSKQLCTMAATREQALEGMARENLSGLSKGSRSAAARASLNRAKHLQASKGQLVTVELAKRLWLGPLSSGNPYSVELESVIWLHFSHHFNPEHWILSVYILAKASADARNLHYRYDVCAVMKDPVPARPRLSHQTRHLDAARRRRA